MNYHGLLVAAAAAMMGQGRPIALLPIKLQKELKKNNIALSTVQQAYNSSLLLDFSRAALFETEEVIHSFGLPSNQLDVAFLLRELCGVETKPLTEKLEDNADG